MYRVGILTSKERSWKFGQKTHGSGRTPELPPVRRYRVSLRVLKKLRFLPPPYKAKGFAPRRSLLLYMGVTGLEPVEAEAGGIDNPITYKRIPVIYNILRTNNLIDTQILRTSKKDLPIEPEQNKS